VSVVVTAALNALKLLSVPTLRRLVIELGEHSAGVAAPVPAARFELHLQERPRPLELLAIGNDAYSAAHLLANLCRDCGGELDVRGTADEVGPLIMRRHHAGD
jgi:hypothetical protein